MLLALVMMVGVRKGEAKTKREAQSTFVMATEPE
jgi:hypothetical protein